MNLLSKAVEASPPVQAVKIVIMTVIAVLLLGLFGTSWYFFTELKDAKEANGQLKEANANLAKDLELVKVGQVAMGLGQLLTTQQKEELDKKVRDTRTALKLKEQEIEKSTDLPEEKARRKSEARMDSVWTMFCHIEPNNTICREMETKK